MKRPLAGATLVYAGGLLLADFLHPPLTVLFGISLGLAVAAVFVAKARRWLLWPLLLFAGWTNLLWRTTPVSPHDLRLIQGEKARLVTVHGRLRETPGYRIYVRDEEESVRSMAQLQVSELQFRGSVWQPVFGEILVITPARLPAQVFAGCAVEVTGVLARPPVPVAEGLFNYRTHLRRQGIYYLLNAPTTNDWHVLEARNARPLCDRFVEWARATLARGLPEEDLPLRLNWAMTLGWRPALTNEVYEPFMRSGTMHIFAISGLHIALIAGILVGLMRVLRVRRNWCGCVAIPLLWFYTAATGWQPSAIRASLMMSIIIGGWAWKRPSDLLNSLAAAAFIILLCDPLQLFGASFQLSFLVVLSIALLVPRLEAARDRLLRIDPLLPTDLLPRWQRWLRASLRVLTTSLAVSLAAWLGSLPLTAQYFHLISPVTLLANLCIVPLSSLALAANLGSIFCGPWLPWLTEWFNYSGWWWMHCMVRISEWTTLLPGAYWYVRAPSGLSVAAYCLVLVGVMSRGILPVKRRGWTLAAAATLAGLCSCQWLMAQCRATLTVIPVNGGMATYFRDPLGHAGWLMDGGVTNSVEFITKPFLRAQGVSRLPALILTHGDLRHIGGAGLIAEMFHAETILTSPVRFRSPTYRRLTQEFAQRPQWVQKISSGNQLGAWTVRHPAAQDRFSRADDAALVLAGNIHGSRVLLLSDLGSAGQRALLDRTADLRAEVVVTGLPGQEEPLSEALLDAIQPRLIVVVDSEFPASERAGPKLKARLAQRNTPVIYTRSTGAVTFEFHRSGWEARTMNGLRFKSGDPSRRSDAIPHEAEDSLASTGPARVKTTTTPSSEGGL